jgi:hypothetical protein
MSTGAGALELEDGLPLRIARAVAAEARRSYRLGAGSAHGPDHWARVAAAGEWIARRLPGPEPTARDARRPLPCPGLLAALELFALAHDCCRTGHGRNLGHGSAAGEWLLAQFGAHPPEGLIRAAEACRDHQRLPEDLRSPVPVPLPVRLCLDANRLDMDRPGVYLPIDVLDLFTQPPRQPGGIERARVYAAGRSRWWLERWGFFALPARTGRPPGLRLEPSPVEDP